MEDYFRGDREVPPRVRDVVWAHVNASPGLSWIVASLHRSCASADDVFSLIAPGIVYIDLTAPFAEPIKVAVFVDQRGRRAARAGTVAGGPPGKTPTTVIEARLARASENDLSIANARLRYVVGALRGKVVEDPDAPAGRTLRRSIVAYCQAEPAMGSGYIGLLPHRDVATARPNCPRPHGR